MKHHIKLIALDMDGTLLNSQLEITPYTRTVLERVMAQGVEIVAITGRPRCAVPKAYFDIPGIRFLITSNGAQVQNFLTGDFIYQSEMLSDTVMRIIKTLKNQDAMLEVFKDGQAYINKSFMPILDRYITDKPFRDDFILNRVTVDDLVTLSVNIMDLKNSMHYLPTQKSKLSGIRNWKKCFQKFVSLPQLLDAG